MNLKKIEWFGRQYELAEIFYQNLSFFQIFVIKRKKLSLTR